ncbi:heparinase II/III family protein [Acetobacter okinawensis]|uniref:heparinase II/III family protein n=1 Tax=Acetobacter okinawensis TaxID=1076594 RepID=UPI0020A0B103|nr:heparinase II/III family protein [Acetobacter okinawensis]MCP1212051.1 heparinase II/III family protein [Acetobacter okinawensis]
MPLRRWTRGPRLAYAMRNPLGGFARVPAAPAVVLRDLWPGNATVGEKLVRNRTEFDGVSRTLQSGVWDDPAWPAAYRRWLQSFGWLQDLRELGAESARIKARTLVSHWIRLPAAERAVIDPSITGARLSAWLGCYEFFAASADDSFRQHLMASLMMEARSIMVLMPEAASGWQALCALKGLLAVAVSIPDYPEFLTRYLRLIDEVITSQILPDGGHITRNPESLFLSVKELAEMLYILQAARLPLPTTLVEAANRTVPALRALRHGDGGLALFNGSSERDPHLVELVLNRASRARVVAAGLPESGFARLSSGRALLIADAAAPAPKGFDHTAHAGMLSFEFSSGKQRLIVNCGASRQKGWAEALRYPAAHSVLELADMAPMTFEPGGGTSRPPQVSRTHATQDGAHWLDMTHNGYESQGGGVYHRQLYLGKDGRTLRGEEKLEGATLARAPCVRFHLHPDIMVEPTENGHLLHSEEESWLFQSDGQVSVEESIYLGQGQRTATLQLVLTPPLPQERTPAPTKPDTAEEHADPEQPAEAEDTAHMPLPLDSTEADTQAHAPENTQALPQEVGLLSAGNDQFAGQEAQTAFPAAPPQPQPAANGTTGLPYPIIGQPPPKSIHWALSLISE